MREFCEFVSNVMWYAAEASEWFWLMAVIAVAVVLLILWLAFRGVRLWYWKVNAQVSSLEKIDLSLQRIEQGLAADPGESKEPVQTSADMPAVPAEESATNSVEESVARAEEAHVSRGKSGRIYTEAELEELIRD